MMRSHRATWILATSATALIGTDASAEPLVSYFQNRTREPAPTATPPGPFAQTSATGELPNTPPQPSSAGAWRASPQGFAGDLAHEKLLVRAASAISPESRAGIDVADFKPDFAEAYQVPTVERLAQEAITPPPSRIGLGVPTLHDLRAPEPTSILLLLTGFVGIAARRHMLRQRV